MTTNRDVVTSSVVFGATEGGDAVVIVPDHPSSSSYNGRINKDKVDSPTREVGEESTPGHVGGTDGPEEGLTFRAPLPPGLKSSRGRGSGWSQGPIEMETEEEVAGTSGSPATEARVTRGSSRGRSRSGTRRSPSDQARPEKGVPRIVSDVCIVLRPCKRAGEGLADEEGESKRSRSRQRAPLGRRCHSVGSGVTEGERLGEEWSEVAGVGLARSPSQSPTPGDKRRTRKIEGAAEVMAGELFHAPIEQIEAKSLEAVEEIRAVARVSKGLRGDKVAALHRAIGVFSAITKAAVRRERALEGGQVNALLTSCQSEVERLRIENSELLGKIRGLETRLGAGGGAHGPPGGQHPASGEGPQAPPLSPKPGPSGLGGKGGGGKKKAPPCLYPVRSCSPLPLGRKGR